MRCGKVVAPSGYGDGIDDLLALTPREVLGGGQLPNPAVETSRDNGETFVVKLLGAGQFHRTRTD